MTHYVACPRPGCDGELEWTVQQDSDEAGSWLYGELSGDTCNGDPPHKLAQAEIDVLRAIIYRRAPDAAVADAEAIIEASARAADG